MGWNGGGREGQERKGLTFSGNGLVTESADFAG